MVTPGDYGEDGHIVLASASPRRQHLLRLLDISFCIQAADIDEEPLPDEQPEAVATRLSREKALAVAAQFGDELGVNSPVKISHACARIPVSGSVNASPREPAEPRHAIVLAADTVVALDGTVLGKPADATEATSMLHRLRGREHRVMTGVAIARAGEIVWSSVVVTRVWMRAYDPVEIDRYVASGSPLDKAGAYGIQDEEFRPVERIEGCHTNVVGLPLCEVRRALSAIGVDGDASPGWTDSGQCDRCALDSTSQRPT